MERKFYTDNFETLLKEHADQFKMTPSKKVWHGIYNNMHPGRRWPSVAMSLVFLFTLVIVGHLNTNNGYKNSTEFTALNDDAQEKINDAQPDKTNNFSKHKQNNSNKNNINESTASDAQVLAENTITDASSTEAKQSFSTTDNINKNTPDNSLQSNNELVNTKERHAVLNTTYDNTNTGNTNLADKQNKKIGNDVLIVQPATINSSEVKNEVAVSDKNNNKVSAKESSNTNQQSSSATALLKIKKNKLSWIYYITPGVSYRTINYREIAASNTATPSAAPPSQINYLGGPAINKPTISVEVGSILNYQLTKRLQFIGGAQLNYSGYNIKAVTTHPAIATLLLNSENIDRPYVVTATSFYGNGTGPSEVTLHNYSLQLSLPVGLQYNLGGSDNLKFNVAATFQPLYVLTEKAYLLSTDKRNYLTQPSLSRKWNMSTDFGTYVSFKSNAFNWQIGPQVHYQLLSTYSPNFPGKEHLIDYGIRFGISKLSK